MPGANEDMYGTTNFESVPRGPYRGRRWSDVPALTLHNILNAVDFGFVELDERRVVAIREGLRAKDGVQKAAATVSSHTDGGRR